MNTLKIKLTGVSPRIVPDIFVDGQYVKCRKNEYGSYEADVQTDKEEVKLAFSRELELKSKLWWLYALISFVIGVFGIFNPPYDKKCISADCVFNIKLKEQSEVKVKFNPLSAKGKAVALETENTFEEIKNEYYVDKAAKRRWIILLIVRIIAWIGLAILLGWLIAKGIG